MRSHLVHLAAQAQHNRYLLCQLVSKVTRKFHKPAKRRVQESVNDAFTRVATDQPEKVMAEESGGEA